MKKLAFALALVATPAAALDVYTLGRFGDWTTTARVNAAGDVACVSDTDNGREVFGIFTTPGEGVSMFITFDDPSSDRFVFSLDVVIEGRSTWNLPDVIVAPGRAHFYFVQPHEALEFLLDLQGGSRLTFRLPGVDRTYGGFSLRGSKMAIDALFDCMNMVGPRA